MSFELPLPAFADDESFSTSSEEARFLQQLLADAAPTADIVAIARRPGVLSKVALRGGLVPGEVVTRLREQLDGEQLQVVQWSAEPRAFIANALGLQDVPPMVLKPAIRHAHVLLGEIDLRGMSGWRGINRLLASSLTGWRIHLQSIAETPAWRSLRLAEARRRPVNATVLERAAGSGPTHGTRPTAAADSGPTHRPRPTAAADSRPTHGTHMTLVEVGGLFAHLQNGSAPEPGEELAVRITRMDPDEGRIWVTTRLAASGQLRLPH